MAGAETLGGAMMEKFGVTRTDMAPMDQVQRIPVTEAFIDIYDPAICLNRCVNKPCTYFCPTQVYQWWDNQIAIDQERCVECGASVMGCPYGNIDWRYPPGGTGVVIKHG